VAPELTAATVLDRYRDETASADRILVDVALDDPPRNVDPQWNLWYGSGGPDTARWIILHMIEETAQHAGWSAMWSTCALRPRAIAAWSSRLPLPDAR
jgi:hypothetical protein